jgi:hypothetical protein
MGQPMEHVLRQCLISLRLAERMGLDEADREPATATRNATVTFSGSSRPVVKLTTALPLIDLTSPHRVTANEDAVLKLAGAWAAAPSFMAGWRRGAPGSR